MSSTDAAALTTLVTQSSIAPFDMIVALSQNEINATLSFLWSTQPTGTPTPGATFSSFNYVNVINAHRGVSLVGHLNAPTVELSVKNGPSRDVLFLLNFGHAVFTWTRLDVLAPNGLCVWMQ